MESKLDVNEIFKSHEFVNRTEEIIRSYVGLEVNDKILNLIKKKLFLSKYYNTSLGNFF